MSKEYTLKSQKCVPTEGEGKIEIIIKIIQSII